MKKWEDIIKERLEEYDCTPPEGSLEAFHQLREAKSAFPGKKGIPWRWILVPAMVSASLAVFLIHHGLQPSGTNPQIIPQAVVTNQPDDIPYDAQTAMVLISNDVKPLSHPTTGQPKEIILADILSHADEIQTTDSFDTPSESQVPEITETIEHIISAPVDIDSLRLTESKRRTGSSWPAIEKVLPSAFAFSLIPLLASATTTPATFTFPAPPDLTADPTVIAPSAASHAFPMKAGIVTSFYFNEHICFSTGIQYTQYRSVFTYDSFGEIKQVVHYLGVPIRVDWSIVSSNLFDIYLGGGFEFDQCIKATFGNDSVKKDRAAFSLVGVGGIRLNLCKNFGLYIQPELVWDITSGNRKLITYRTEHPLMFDVSTGLRIVF